MPAVEIFTDGACLGNPGPGGWGVILRYGKTEKELSGGETETTNNRMELTAVIEALKAIKKNCEIIISTDSRYVMDGVCNGCLTGNKTAGKLLIKNPLSKIWICGKNLTFFCKNTM